MTGYTVNYTLPLNATLASIASDLAALINLDDVRKDGINLLKRTRLAKDAGVVNALEQGMSNAAVRDPV